MFGSKSKINNFFALKTSTTKILRLLANTCMPTRPKMGKWIWNYWYSRKDLNKRLSQNLARTAPKSNKQRWKLCYGFTYINYCFILIFFDYVLQNICHPFYKFSRLCNYIFYFGLEKRTHKPNHFMHSSYARFGNTSVFFWIRITLGLLNCPLIILGADVLSN